MSEIGDSIAAVDATDAEPLPTQQRLASTGQGLSDTKDTSASATDTFSKDNRDSSNSAPAEAAVKSEKALSSTNTVEKLSTSNSNSAKELQASKEIDTADGINRDQSRGGMSQLRRLFLVLIVVSTLYIGYNSGELLARAVSRKPSNHKNTEPTRSEMIFDDEEDVDEDEDPSVKYMTELQAFYTRHNPDHMGDIPVILAKFKGREDELYAKLQKKYGEAPGSVAKRKSKTAPEDGDDEEDDEDEGTGTDEIVSERKNMGALNSKTKKVQTKAESKKSRTNQNRIVKITEDDDEDDDEGKGTSGRYGLNDNVEGAGNVESKPSVAQTDMNNNNYQTGDDDDEVEAPAEPDLSLDVDSNFDLSQEVVLDPILHHHEQVISRGGEAKMHASKVKLIVIGLERTGLRQVELVLKSVFTSLNVVDEAESSRRLGPVLLGKVNNPQFNAFDNEHVVSGMVPGLYFEELMVTYPNAKFVICIRDQASWWREMQRYAQAMVVENPCVKQSSEKEQSDCEVERELRLASFRHGFGMTRYYQSDASAYLWKRKYFEYYDRVLRVVPRSRRKLIDLYSSSSGYHDKTFYWLFKFVRETVGEELAPTEAELTDKGNAHDSDLSHRILGKSIPVFERDNTIPDSMARLHLLPSVESTLETPEHVNGEAGRLKVFLAGLDNTGVASVRTALKKLGYTFGGVSHIGDSTSLTAATTSDSIWVGRPGARVPNFGMDGVFAGVDVAGGGPMSPFFLEVIQANPDCKVILTVRALASWWPALKDQVALVSRKTNSHRHKGGVSQWSSDAVFRTWMEYTYGAQVENLNAYSAMARHHQHVERVLQFVPESRLLLLDPYGDTPENLWRSLCDFIRDRRCSRVTGHAGFQVSE